MTRVPHTAMVLAAGLGLRMRPLSADLPKPLVRFKGKPLVDHALDRLAEAGVARAVINVHHRADQLTAHLADRKRPKIIISDERDKLLDTGGGIVKALAQIGQDPFLIHNADSVWIEGVGSNIVRLSDMWDSRRMDALLLVALGATSLGYEGRGDFAMSTEGALRRRGEREVVPFVFTGVSIAHPRLFDDAPAGPFSINTVWDRAIAPGRVFGMRHDGIWMHIGSPAALAEAEAYVEHESV
jgi:MurNAc alpha-1-phosphate uridylyltransferase